MNGIRNCETHEDLWNPGNYHPREMLINWFKYENEDDETQTLATLASPLFGCHIDEYTSKVEDPRFKEVGYAVSEYDL